MPITINKAIEILSSNGLCPEGTTWGEYLEAVKLGREALNYIERSRVFGQYPVNELLPGETEE